MDSYRLLVRTPFFLATLTLLTMGVFSKRGWLDWQRMLKHNKDLTAQIEQLKSQRMELEKQLQSLESSPLAQEQAVRQHLGYLRKDEIELSL